MRAYLSFAIVCLFATNALAVPLRLSYQGRLLNSSDQPLAGTLAVTFDIWDAATGPSSQWSETQNVTFDNGYFSVILGGTNPIDENTLDQTALWFSLTVGGQEMLPRQPIASAPYAVMAGTAENVAGGIVDATSISVGGSPIVNSSGDWVGTPPPDTLDGLTCTTGQLISYNGAAWACANPVGGAESDPVYAASAASAIAAGDLTNWDAAYGWGNHGNAGYLSSEADPQVGSVTNNSWCVGTGSQVSCTQAAPLTSEADPQVGALTNGRWCTTDGTTVNCTSTAPLTSESDPQVGTTTNGNWCVGNGTQINCTASAPLTSESDPQVGITTNGNWCVGNGSQVSCTASAPLTSESDPQVGTLTSGRWCTTNGTLVNCTSTAPVDTRCDNTTCGAVTASSYEYSVARQSYVSIAGAAFTAQTSAGGYGSTGGGGGPGRYVLGIGSQNLVASVSLPHGATITELTCRFDDSSIAYNVQFGLIHPYLNQWVCGAPYSTSSTGSSGPQSMTFACAGAPTVNSETSSYMIRFWNDAACADSCVIYGCSVGYTMSEVP